MKKQTTYTIDFEPIGQRGECQRNEHILDCARRNGLGINSICGGKGKCQSCRIQVISGITSKPTSIEHEVFSTQEIKQGWRLACQVYPYSNIKLKLPTDSMTTLQRIQVEGSETVIRPEPPVRSYQLHLDIPTLSTPQSDDQRLLNTLNQKYDLHCTRIDIKTLHTLSSQLRSWNWECQALVRNDEVISISQGKKRQIGLAVDIGTTKVAGYLVDLSDGHTLANKGIMNPQISYGEDIISRIDKAMISPNEGAQLKNVIVEALNELIENLCTDICARTEEIIEVVIVGNTAMHHLLLNLPLRQLALFPFIPAVSSALDMKARDLGLNIASGSYVHLMPNIAGFVGSDHVAMLLAAKLWQVKSPTLALDIGTNTEVSLIIKGNITTVSCASGPAFEGGHIRCGMRASSGAIERLRIADDSIQYQTVDQKIPVGICGSGILDTIAQLYLAGIINDDGSMTDNHSRVRTSRGQREFVLVSKEERDGKPPIVITQRDIRELQLAKAAIRTGIQILLEENNCADEEIRHVIIAGAFGTYIDINSAISIGMLPSLPINRFHQIGNAAGMGAKLALISLVQRAKARVVASKIKYIELAGTPNFEKTFINATYLGRHRISAGTRNTNG